MILVRHAESEWNRLFARTRVDPGIRDPGLTEVGRAQAEALIEQVATLGVRTLIASPYRRTIETATTVAKALDLPVTIDPIVRERCVFSCDIGTPASLLSEHWPDLAFDHLEEQWWGEGEESAASVAERATRFRRRFEPARDHGTTAVITHWGFIRACTGHEVANATWVRID
jgi:broad specificity phosphatase PhoE